MFHPLVAGKWPFRVRGSLEKIEPLRAVRILKARQNWGHGEVASTGCAIHAEHG